MSYFLPDWKSMTWGELATLEYGKGIRGYQNSAGKYPVFGTNGQIGWHEEYLCPKEGIIVGRKGAYRGIHYSHSPFFVIDTAFYIKPIIERSFNTRWAFYQLLDFDINNMDSGSAIPSTSRDAFYSIKLNVPPLPTQRKIASILSAYDDLIKNNLRRITILEEMTQNLYREWFVKFRYPGHENARFVDSPMGRIPQGWGVKILGSLITEHIGGGWGKDIEDKKHTQPGWVIRGTDIPNARICNIVHVPFRFHTNSNLKSRRLLPGDIVFEVSGGSKDQSLGRSLYISSELLSSFKGDDVICASFCKRIQPNSEKFASEILYLSFLDAYTSGEIEQFQVQSTGISNFKWTEYLEKESRCIPPLVIQERFRELIVPIFFEITTLGRKNAILQNTRDLLLPKLISGELDVSLLEINISKEEDS